MRDGFEPYRTELDALRLTEESRRALADRLARREGADAAGRPRRMAGGLRRAAILGAAACLLAGIGGAAAISGAPTMRDRFFGGDSVGYQQSGGFVGKAVENNGWTLSITDCVGDDYYIYLGMELEAPEGTVLDAADYDFRSSSVRFLDSSLYGTWSIVPLPDGDPADNRLPLMWLLYSSQPGVNGAAVRLRATDLGHGWTFRAGGEDEYELDCGGTWDFGYVTVRYPDNILRLDPHTPVRARLDGPDGVREVEAAVSEVHISPLALYVWISGEELVLHHGAEAPRPGETYYDCGELQEVLAYDREGRLLAMRPGLPLRTGEDGRRARHTSGRTGSGGCSGYSESEGFLWLAFGFDSLTDVNQVAKIVVNGVEIPLP